MLPWDAGVGGGRRHVTSSRMADEGLTSRGWSRLTVGQMFDQCSNECLTTVSRASWACRGGCGRQAGWVGSRGCGMRRGWGSWGTGAGRAARRPRPGAPAAAGGKGAGRGPRGGRDDSDGRGEAWAVVTCCRGGRERVRAVLLCLAGGGLFDHLVDPRCACGCAGACRDEGSDRCGQRRSKGMFNGWPVVKWLTGGQIVGRWSNCWPVVN